MPLRLRACETIAASAIVPPVIAAWALNGAGLAHYEVARFSEAVVAFEAAIRANPGDPHVYNNLANVHRARGDLGQAAQAYSEALAADPQYGRAYINRGMVLFVQGDFQQALTDLDKSVQLQPHASSPLTVRGNIKLAMGDTGGAVVDQTAAIALNPEYPLPYSNRGCASLIGGNIGAARADFLQALSLSEAAFNADPQSKIGKPLVTAPMQEKVRAMLYLTDPATARWPRRFDIGLRRLQEVICGEVPGGL